MQFFIKKTCTKKIQAFLRGTLFFNLASVLLKLSHELSSSVAQVLLNTYQHHYIKTPLIFTICLDLRLFMPCLLDLFFIFVIIFTMINHIFIMIIIYNDFQRFGGSKFLNGCFISLTNACEECNNFQDSRQMFMISYFKDFPRILLRQLNFGVLSI